MRRRVEVSFAPPGKFVVVESIRLHYVSQGTGKPVVLIHGNPGLLQEYTTSVFQGFPEGYRLLAFDRPGFGYSERPENEVATIEAQARLLHGALQMLDVTRPVFVGSSFGSSLALNYALQYPLDISAMVLLGAVAYPRIFLPGLPSRIRHLTPAKIAGAGLRFVLSGPLGRVLFSLVIPKSFGSDMYKSTLALWTRPSQIRAMLEDQITLNTSLRAMLGRYSEIRVPTIIIVGECDRLASPVHQSKRLNQAMTGSKLVVLEKTGHMIVGRRPGVLVNAICQASQLIAPIA